MGMSLAALGLAASSLQNSGVAELGVALRFAMSLGGCSGGGLESEREAGSLGLGFRSAKSDLAEIWTVSESIEKTSAAFDLAWDCLRRSNKPPGWMLNISGVTSRSLEISDFVGACRSLGEAPESLEDHGRSPAEPTGV